jgi:hypothetical protein
VSSVRSRRHFNTGPSRRRSGPHAPPVPARRPPSPLWLPRWISWLYPVPWSSAWRFLLAHLHRMTRRRRRHTTTAGRRWPRPPNAPSCGSRLVPRPASTRSRTSTLAGSRIARNDPTHGLLVYRTGRSVRFMEVLTSSASSSYPSYTTTIDRHHSTIQPSTLTGGLHRELHVAFDHEIASCVPFPTRSWPLCRPFHLCGRSRDRLVA